MKLLTSYGMNTIMFALVAFLQGAVVEPVYGSILLSFLCRTKRNSNLDKQPRGIKL